MRPVVLASSSTYRAELLRKLRIDFIASSSDIDESPLPDEAPEHLAQRLAHSKACAVSQHYPKHLIIGSDQVAVCGNTLLGKPGTKQQSIAQLKVQSGQIVHFFTAISVLDSQSGRCLSDLDVCEVHFKSLSMLQIQRYVDLEQPFDCAGSFKSEGYGIVLFEKIVAEDPNALVGLPLIKLVRLLNQFGLELP